MPFMQTARYDSGVEVEIVNVEHAVGRGAPNHRDDVKCVQYLLSTMGYPLAVDGFYRPRTQAAIRAYQDDMRKSGGGTVTDGRVDRARGGRSGRERLHRPAEPADFSRWSGEDKVERSGMTRLFWMVTTAEFLFFAVLIVLISTNTLRSGPEGPVGGIILLIPLVVLAIMGAVVYFTGSEAIARACLIWLAFPLVLLALSPTIRRLRGTGRTGMRKAMSGSKGRSGRWLTRSTRRIWRR